MELRILQIDLARQKEHPEFIASYARMAKKYGYNALLMYLETAVRTEATRCFSHESTYSMDEIRDIVSLVENEGIMAIPAFENLDHMGNIMLYPEFCDLAECEDESKEGRNFSALKRGSCACVSNHRLYEVMDAYISEVASAFRAPYIHMGLDEPFDFALCARCKARLAFGETKADMFCEHVLKTHKLASSLGKRMMMWDDFFEYLDITDRLPKDIIMCNWNYNYVGAELPGHWTNRKKRDWFLHYENLGFDYIFCPRAHENSALYNLESITEYANKYHPMGALMTSWEFADNFYQSTYPLVAYAGLLWSGKSPDKLDVYTELLGNRDAARLVLSLNVPNAFGGFGSVHKMCEDDSSVEVMVRSQLEYAVWALEDKCDNDVMTSLYCRLRQHYLTLKLQSLGSKIFNIREKRTCNFEEIYFELDEIEAGFAYIKEKYDRLWEKYRNGIKSEKGAFESRFIGLAELISEIRNSLNEETVTVGVLSLDLMLHDSFCTVRGAVRVKYEGDESEVLVYRGGMKSSLVNYEVGGAYYLRFKIPDRKIEYLMLDVFGEGALYPLNVRYRACGELYVASEAEVISGHVVNEKNILINDTQFAEMGINDGDRHFDDISLSKELNTVKLTFKPFV